MFTRRFKLFTLLGFPIHIDLSWFVILFVLAWSLAAGFSQRYEGLGQAAAWAMGMIGAVLLFVSVLLHELGHAVVARMHDIRMKGITLFFFGGVAEMTDEPPSPKAEFQVAIAGPVVSLALAALFFIVSILLPTGAAVTGGQGMTLRVTQPAAAMASGVISYLAVINFLLVVFNSVPAFPLDGGRVLRALLWHLKGNLRRATRVTARIGAGFGGGLIMLGVFALLLAGNWLAFIWLGLLGLFLRGAAAMSYQQVQFRQLLEGERVRDFMNDQPVTVPNNLDIRRFVEDYVYRYHFKLFPVVEDGRLIGCVSTRQVKEVPQDDWSRVNIKTLLQGCDQTNTIAPDADATEALTRMNQQGVSRLMVVEGADQLVGVISLKDLMGFLSLKIDLEDDDAPPSPAHIATNPEPAATPRTA